MMKIVWNVILLILYYFSAYNYIQKLLLMLSGKKEIQKKLIADAQKKLSSSLLYEQYISKLFCKQQPHFKFTQTYEKISYEEGKIISTKKIQSEVITWNVRDKPVKAKLSSLDFQLPATTHSLLEEQEALFNYILEQAISTIGEQLQSWIQNWQKHLNNRNTILSIIVTIEDEYQKMKQEIKQILQNKKLTIINNNMYDPPCLDDLITSLYQQFPQLEEFFELVDFTSLNYDDMQLLYEMKSQTLGCIFDISQIQQIMQKKQKKKNKKKNKKNKKTKDQQSKNKQKKITTEQDQTYQKLNQLLNSLELNENRRQCRVSNIWLNKLEKDIKRLRHI